MINLYVCKGVAYVWNSEDWQTLRTQQRICGSLIGTVPAFPRQNDFQGLPMALMSEEAVLLVKNGICELIELPNINSNLSEEQRQEIEGVNKRVIEEQSEALRKRKIDQLSQKIDIILAGKKQKLISKGILNVNLSRETLLQEEITKVPSLAPTHVLVHLPTEHCINTESKKVSVDVLIPPILDKKGSLRYNVFKDLWEKGHYITSGSKFGADFLVYPGDPVKFHAMYMLKCMDQDTMFRPTNLVAFGRLSVAVNKLAVLAFLNTFGKIEYQTLQWHESLHS